MVVHFGFWAFLLQSNLTATLFTLQIHSDEERLYVRELILFGFYSRLTSSPNPVRRSLVTKTLVSAHLARLSACWRDRAPAAVVNRSFLAGGWLQSAPPRRRDAALPK